MAKKKESKLIKETAEEMLEKIGLKAKVEIGDEDNEVVISVEDQEPGVLIGYHGETLDSFQHLLKMILFKKTNQWPSLAVEAAGYRENRKKMLETMAQSAAQQVKLSGRSFRLPPLSSFERRVVHLALVDEEGVVTESEGEGRERRVVVKPKKES